MIEGERQGGRLRRTAVVPEALAGLRTDRALARLFPDLSRTRLRAWLEAGLVRLDGRSPRPRDPVRGGEHVVLDVVLAPVAEDRPEPIPLRIVHEDETLIVLDKPPGLVVHPAAGNPAGTLVNALLHHDAALAALPRAGIVHRLDKDTSGLMVVARTPAAHKALVAALARREVMREYEAVVRGVMTAGGTVEAPIGRHPVRRQRQAVVPGGRPAVTHYRVMERFRAHTRVRVRLETGRTHQIRVHMAHIGHPVVGDPLYGGRPVLPRGATPELAAALRGFRRQALHAVRLALRHPATGEPCAWQAPLPADMAALVAVLRADRDTGEGA